MSMKVRAGTTHDPAAGLRVQRASLAMDELTSFYLVQVMEPGGPTTVLFNDEVSAVAHLRVRGPKERGESVMADDIEAIEGIELIADPKF